MALFVFVSLQVTFLFRLDAALRLKALVNALDTVLPAEAAGLTLPVAFRPFQEAPAA
jgi:hypothetical protein